MVPKKALPHYLSIAGRSMTNLGTCLFTSKAYQVKDPPVSKKTVYQYAQLSIGLRKDLPVYDYSIPCIEPSPHDIFIDPSGHVQQTKIEWKVWDLIELYVLSVNFGHARVCDIVMDELLRRCREEEATNGIEFSETEVFGVDIHAIRYILKYTPVDIPIRSFWQDLCDYKRINLHRSRSTGYQILPDRHTSAERSCLKKGLLFESSKDGICGQYHWHKDRDEVCYLINFEARRPKRWDPQPWIEDKKDDCPYG
jgi:hypothetical protein